MTITTKHAQNRIKERTSFVHNNSAADALTQKVLQKGREIEDFTSTKIKKYLNNLYIPGGDDRYIIVYGNNAYIFNKSKTFLITVLQIPQKVLQNRSKFPEKRDEKLYRKLEQDYDY